MGKNFSRARPFGNGRRDSEGQGRRDSRSSFGRDSGGFEERGRSFGGRSEGRSFGRPEGRPFTKSRDSEWKDMFEVVCDKCGKTCEVPFKPTASKPVYCRECFRANNDSNPRASSMPSNNVPNTSSIELEKINKKLDKILKALDIE